MAMNSRATYQALKEAGKPWLTQAGFRPKGSSGLWIRPEASAVEAQLMFQCDKNGWHWDGSQFTVNFFLMDVNEPCRPRRDLRFGKLVTAMDEGRWIELTNRVVSKIRLVDQPPLYDWEYPEDRDYALKFEEGFSAGNDPWLRYLDKDDVTMWWAEFLEPAMEGMLERFLSFESEKTP